MGNAGVLCWGWVGGVVEIGKIGEGRLGEPIYSGELR